MEKLKKVKNDLSKQKNYHENKLICSKYFATNVIKGTLDQAQDFELALEYGWVLKKNPFILVIKVKWGQMKFSNMQKSSVCVKNVLKTWHAKTFHNQKNVEFFSKKKYLEIGLKNNYHTEIFASSPYIP